MNSSWRSTPSRGIKGHRFLEWEPAKGGATHPNQKRRLFGRPEQKQCFAVASPTLRMPARGGWPCPRVSACHQSSTRPAFFRLEKKPVNSRFPSELGAEGFHSM